MSELIVEGETPSAIDMEGKKQVDYNKLSKRQRSIDTEEKKQVSYHIWPGYQEVGSSEKKQ